MSAAGEKDRYETPQRAIVVFAEDSGAGEDVHALLSLIDSRPLHPAPDGFGRGKQEPWSDNEVRDLAWNLIQRLAGKVTWGGSLIVPEVTRNGS